MKGLLSLWDEPHFRFLEQPSFSGLQRRDQNFSVDVPKKSETSLSVDQNKNTASLSHFLAKARVFSARLRPIGHCVRCQCTAHLISVHHTSQWALRNVSCSARVTCTPLSRRGTGTANYCTCITHIMRQGRNNLLCVFTFLWFEKQCFVPDCPDASIRTEINSVRIARESQANVLLCGEYSVPTRDGECCFHFCDNDSQTIFSRSKPLETLSVFQPKLNGGCIEESFPGLSAGDG